MAHMRFVSGVTDAFSYLMATFIVQSSLKAEFPERNGKDVQSKYDYIEKDKDTNSVIVDGIYRFYFI